MRHKGKISFIETIKKYSQLSVFLIFSGAALSVCATSQAQTLGELLTTQDYTEIRLKKLATGHEMVRGAINGQEGQFILDSGAGITVIHSSEALRFKLNIDKSSSVFAAGAGGQGKIFEAQIDYMSIGGEVLDMKKVFVLDLSHVVNALKQATGEHIHGVVGQDVLTAHNGIIDVKNSRLYLIVK